MARTKPNSSKNNSNENAKKNNNLPPKKGKSNNKPKKTIPKKCDRLNNENIDDNKPLAGKRDIPENSKKLIFIKRKSKKDDGMGHDENEEQKEIGKFDKNNNFNKNNENVFYYCEFFFYNYI